jgi:hypothetical protein
MSNALRCRPCSSAPWRTALWSALIAGVAAGAPASAEVFADAFIGGAFTQIEPFSIESPGSDVSNRTRYQGSATGGLRGGIFPDPVPWLGVAGEVSAFAPHSPDADIRVVPVSLLIFLRLPPEGPEGYEVGDYYPYVGAGAGAFFSTFDFDAGPIDAQDWTVDVGLDLRAGLRWKAAERFSLFFEYRFTHVEPEWNDSVGGVDTDFKAKLQTHHLNLGVSVPF